MDYNEFIKEAVKISEGAYGNVYIYRKNNDLRVIAVKTALNDSEDINKQLYNEINILNYLKSTNDDNDSNAKKPHPNIIQIFAQGYFSGSSSSNFKGLLYYEMELGVMDMKNALTTSSFFSSRCHNISPITLKHKWIHSVLSAVNYLHLKNVAHCDLSSNNFIVFGNNDIKLVDFGGSFHDVWNLNDIDKNQSQSRGCGWYKIPYRAPELALCRSFFPRYSDIWAVGCVVFEIFFDGELLFNLWDNDLDMKLLSMIRKKIGMFPPRYILSKKYHFLNNIEYIDTFDDDDAYDSDDVDNCNDDNTDSIDNVDNVENNDNNINSNIIVDDDDTNKKEDNNNIQKNEKKIKNVKKQKDDDDVIVKIVPKNKKKKSLKRLQEYDNDYDKHQLNFPFQKLNLSSYNNNNDAIATIFQQTLKIDLRERKVMSKILSDFIYNLDTKNLSVDEIAFVCNDIQNTQTKQNNLKKHDNVLNYNNNDKKKKTSILVHENEDFSFVYEQQQQDWVLVQKSKKENNDTNTKKLQTQYDILKFLGCYHPNILKLQAQVQDIASISTNTNTNMIVYKDHVTQTLKRYLTKNNEKNQHLHKYCKYDWIKQVIKSIAYCHRNGVALTNLTTASFGIVPNCNQIKLMDFTASCKDIKREEESLETVEFVCHVDMLSPINNLCYTAIEILTLYLNHEYANSSTHNNNSDKNICSFAAFASRADIWSLGCIIYEIYTQNILFQGDTVFEALESIHKFMGISFPKKYCNNKLTERFAHPNLSIETKIAPIFISDSNDNHNSNNNSNKKKLHHTCFFSKNPRVRCESFRICEILCCCLDFDVDERANVTHLCDLLSYL